MRKEETWRGEFSKTLEKDTQAQILLEGMWTIVENDSYRLLKTEGGRTRVLKGPRAVDASDAGILEEIIEEDKTSLARPPGRAEGMGSAEASNCMAQWLPVDAGAGQHQVGGFTS